MYWLAYLVVLIVGLGLTATAIILIQKFFSNQNQMSRWLENIVIAFGAVFLTFMILELGFKLAFAQSDGFRYTLAAKNWYSWYWQENSLGYRDQEWTAEELADKTKVMVVGDSFVAGTGIANPENRFANVLGHLLGDDFAIIVVASPGWDTLDEIEAIVNHPFAPDVLVLSYFINDIEGTAYATGAQRPRIRQDPLGWLKTLVDNSYAINFLYWRLIRLGPREWATVYWEDWLKRIGADPDIRWRHQRELLKIIEGAASEQIPLLVVVFPNLAAVEESQFLTQPVIDLFQSHNVPLLDVAELLVERDPQTTMVNAVDSHPNEQINAEVAEQIYRMMVESKIVTAK